MPKHISIYVRVSSKTQDHRSQLPDLERWAESQDERIKWYKDKASGKTMNRPSWNELESNIRSGKVSQVVVWRLDRLGRTASGLTSLFDELQIRKINLVSIKDGLDLSTAAGRLMANVLASVAQYDNEVRSERQAAGIAKAKAQGKKWGGSMKGTRTKVTDDKIEIIRHMKEKGKPITAISKAVGLSRPTIYGVLEQI
ncbi:recombinase family protein [uncultured Gimesia sp.]|uniref:recombinase family protein n=1 Tax=uncultured Gimesia sp. TaxID=1678688 RepID=UPI0030DC91C0|tara:strand:- start:63016 stop:63609 length:594 start_codon:yes stop_codon:yes gene_type:complete